MLGEVRGWCVMSGCHAGLVSLRVSGHPHHLCGGGPWRGEGWPVCKVVSALLSCSGVVMLNGDLRSGVTQSSLLG